MCSVQVSCDDDDDGGGDGGAGTGSGSSGGGVEAGQTVAEAVMIESRGQI